MTTPSLSKFHGQRSLVGSSPQGFKELDTPEEVCTHISDVYEFSVYFVGFPGGASGKEPVCQFRRHERRGFNP